MKSNQEEPLSSLLFMDPQRLSKNKSQMCGPKKALSGFAKSAAKDDDKVHKKQAGRRSQGSLRCFSDME